MSWKRLLVVTCKVVSRFVDTLAANDKYCLLSREISMQTVQMNLSEKQKTFSRFLCKFFKSTLIVEHF